MIIRSITIKNFQSYFDTEIIPFSEGLNLIIGNGGKGKSKLFNAFYWVLFGRIYITDFGWAATNGLPQSAKGKMHKHDFINQKALYEASIGDKIVCSVQLEIDDDKGVRYDITRQVEAVRTDYKDWLSPFAWEVSSSYLKVSYDDITGTVVKTDEYAEDKISQLFPEGIRGYIWFQGESLDELINFQKEQNLRDAVRHISYFPFYEKLTSIITKSQDKISRLEARHLREANQHNAEVRRCINNIEDRRNKLSREEEKRGEIIRLIEKIQIALADDEGKVRGIAGFTDLVAKYERCEHDITRVTNEISAIDERQRELLPKLWVLRGSETLVERCKEIIASHVDEVYTVPEKKYLDNPSREKLEEILNRDHQCFVCGSKVDDEHPDAVEWIRNRIRAQDEFLREMSDYRANLEAAARFNMFIGKIQDYPSSLLVALSQIDQQYADSEERLEKLMAKRRQLLTRKRQLDEEIEEVKRKYGVDPHKEASRINVIDKEIKMSRSTLESKQRELRATETLIQQYKNEIKDFEQELKSYGTITGTIASVPETEWNNISVFLEDICKRVQEKARKELLSKIEQRANAFYSKFTEHDNGYKGRVEIGDDYTIRFDPLLNTSHEDRKKMSIINALLSLNQEAMCTFYPFISDAPTSSFDPNTTHKYLLGIKDIFEQSIIMTKDVEVDSDKFNDLVSQKNVSRIYQLTSRIYRDDSKEPEIYEVSTKVTPLKPRR